MTIQETLGTKRTATIGTLTYDNYEEFFKLSIRPDNSVQGNYSIVVHDSATKKTTSIRMFLNATMEVSAALNHFEQYLNTDLRPGYPKATVKGLVG